MSIKQTTKVIGTMAVGNPIRNVPPKTIAAVVLVAVMGVLWARVLLRSGPDTALANPSMANIDLAGQEKAESAIQIRAVGLTEIPGRHDTIAADIFRADRCLTWGGQKTESAAPTTKAADNQRMVNELIKAIALEAIVKNTQGKAENACINGTLVTAGSVLQVFVQNGIQTVRVMTVQPGRVQLNWQDRTIDIEMPDQKVN